jgi:hypothetical protein
MDASFIQQNQIIERYLMGRLPLKFAQDFERYCRENPDSVVQLGLPDRINAALRMLDAAGQPEPWTEKPAPLWLRTGFVIGLGGLAAVLLVVTLMLGSAIREKNGRIDAQQLELQQQPLQPIQGAHAVTIEPSRQGPPGSSAAIIGGGRVELAELKLDMSWSRYSTFHVTIDRINQGRLAEFGNMARDSNGDVRLALNSSVLGPGDYAVTIEGLDKWGKPVSQAWTRFSSIR